MIMSAFELLPLMIKVGFPTHVAVTMTAIALRESSGNPDAFNGNEKTGDRSYGLFQLNMFGNLSAIRMKLFGITEEKQLFDPETNARCAFILWGNHNKNLDIAWYITRSPYKEKYEIHLPAAQNAAIWPANVNVVPLDVKVGSTL